LSLQLGFAIIPLIHFVSDKSKMKGFILVETSSIMDCRFDYCCIKWELVLDEINGWLEASENPILWLTVVPLAFSFLILLLYIVFKPFVTKSKIAIQIIRHTI
jgi:manganese transport protein